MVRKLFNRARDLVDWSLHAFFDFLLHSGQEGYSEDDWAELGNEVLADLDGNRK